MAQTEKTPHSETSPGSSAGPASRRALLCAACALPLLAACGATSSTAGTITDSTPPATLTPTATRGTKKKRKRSAGGSSSSSSSGSSSSSPSTSPSPSSGSSSSPSTKTSSTATQASAPAPAGALVLTGDVPVGGGVVLFKKGYVVTQPTKGTFHGFSTICTHAGCQVGAVYGGTIDCPCHGSRFSITDGAVVHGPARLPLPSKAVAVKSGWVVKA